MSTDQINIGPGLLEKVLIEQVVYPKQVLLIDDSENDMMAVKAFSRGYHCEWTWARNYDDGVEVLATRNVGYFKLIFLDLKLGTYEECFRMFTHIKRSRFAPVMVMSGHLDTDIMSKILKIGFAGFVEKPANFNHNYFSELFDLVDIKKKLDA